MLKQIKFIAAILMLISACGSSEISNSVVLTDTAPLTPFMENQRVELLDILSANVAGSNVASVPVYVITKENFDSHFDSTKVGVHREGYIALKQFDGERCVVLAHELLHAALEQTTGDGDSEHLDPRFHDDTFSKWCMQVNGLH